MKTLEKMFGENETKKENVTERKQKETTNNIQQKVNETNDTITQ